MQNDPMQELARLREYYHPMSDEELLELEGQMKDLSPTAQQVLTEELSQRGIGKTVNDAQRVWRGGAGEEQLSAEAVGDGVVRPDRPSAPAVFDAKYQMQDSKGQIYSYKTLLCECEELDHAWQINELLRRHGIQSWIGKPSFANVEFPLGPRVEVAADQLEQAKLIIAQPMPQEIIDEFREMNEDVREYEPPKCPQCGAEDPILENAEPVNQWLCESCGKQWSEGAVEVN